MSLSKEILAYLSRLVITQGRLSGELFPVLPWQRRFVKGAFHTEVQDSALSVARGNGKTTMVAGIGAAALDGPLAVPRGDTVLVASSFEQARIAFEHIVAFMGDKLDDRNEWKVWDTAQQAMIQNRDTLARVRCIGSDPKRAHGLAPVLILADEPAQWPENTGEKMVAALRTAAGKQPHCRFIALGTRPSDGEHWFGKMLAGGAQYGQMHAAEQDDNRRHKSTWKKANPSLSVMPDLEAAICREAAQAELDPALAFAFDALRLNLGTDDTEHSLLLDAALWQQYMGESERRGPCVWGIDLGTSAAQSAIAAYYLETGRLEALAAFPADPDLEERGRRDGVGPLYRECARRGELLVLGGAATDIASLIQAGLDRFGPPSLLVSDRWREAELRDALVASAVTYAPMELRGQGFKDGAEDVRAFRRAFAEGKVKPTENKLLASAMSVARTVSDPAGNAKLAKGAQGGRRARARDDAAAAAILAVSAGQRHRQMEAPERKEGENPFDRVLRR